MMAKRNGVFALLVTFLTVGFWANQTWMIADKPEGLLDLEDELVELNEQLIVPKYWLIGLGRYIPYLNRILPYRNRIHWRMMLAYLS